MLEARSNKGKIDLGQKISSHRSSAALVNLRCSRTLPSAPLFRYVDEQAFRFSHRKDADNKPLNDGDRLPHRGRTTQQIWNYLWKEVSGLTQEVQLEINTISAKSALLWKKRLRDPDGVFIHAEEQRKQLAKQGKKSNRK